MSLYVKLSMQEIADGLTAIGWSGAGGGGDASLSYGSTAPLAPTNGTLWYDTTEEILKLFRVDTWVNISVTQSVINNINAQVTLAQSYAQDAQEALAEFTSIVATATTLAPESSATATFNASTGVITLGIPAGAKGDTGDVSLSQLTTALSLKADTSHSHTKTDVGLGSVDNTSDSNKPVSTATQTALNAKANLSSNTYTAPQRTNTSASSNAIDFRIANNFTISATAANITVTSLAECIGQSGVIVIENAQNVAGWGAEFNFKTVPSAMSGMEVFSYFVQTETVIRIGRVS